MGGPAMRLKEGQEDDERASVGGSAFDPHATVCRDATAVVTDSSAPVRPSHPQGTHARCLNARSHRRSRGSAHEPPPVPSRRPGWGRRGVRDALSRSGLEPQCVESVRARRARTTRAWPRRARRPPAIPPDIFPVGICHTCTWMTPTKVMTGNHISTRARSLRRRHRSARRWATSIDSGSVSCSPSKTATSKPPATGVSASSDVWFSVGNWLFT